MFEIPPQLPYNFYPRVGIEPLSEPESCGLVQCSHCREVFRAVKFACPFCRCGHDEYSLKYELSSPPVIQKPRFQGDRELEGGVENTDEFDLDDGHPITGAVIIPYGKDNSRLRVMLCSSEDGTTPIGFVFKTMAPHVPGWE